MQLAFRMRLPKLLAAAALAVSLAVPAVASAEGSRTASLRSSVQALEARAKAVRDRADRTRSATVKKESERIVSMVELQRRFIATRLQIFDLLGDAADEEAIADTESRCASAEKLLAVVEGWFGAR